MGMGGESSFISFMCGRWGERKRNVCLFLRSCTHVPGLGEDVGVLPNSLKTGPLTDTGVCPFQLAWLVPPSSLLGLYVCMDMAGFYGDMNSGPYTYMASAFNYWAISPI